MSTDSSPHQRLSHILLLAIEEIHVLLDILNEEYQLLQKTSVDALEKLTATKKQQIDRLAAVITQQNNFLVELRLSPDRQGLETFIQSLPSKTPAREHWKQFKQMLNACRNQNEINGTMLAHSQRQVTHTLNLLRGIPEGQKTYGPSGEACSNQAATSLGKA